MNQENFRKQISLGWLLSLIFHVLLGLTFWIIIIDTSITEDDFAEVHLTQFVRSELNDNSRQRFNTAAPQRQNQRENRQQKLVDLPKRRMLEDEKPTILEDAKDKAQFEETVQQAGKKVDPLSGRAMESQVKPGTSLPGQRDLPTTRKIDVGEKVSTELSTEGIGGTQISKKPYEIRWEGGDRDILADPLPGFPEGVQREVVLKMRITVLPDGTMGQVIPLQKGDATLESITIQALKKWRFNALEPSAPQENQTGTITFRFILK